MTGGVSGEVTPRMPLVKRVWSAFGRISLHLTVALLLVALLVFALGGRMVKTLHSGELGVMFHRFGDGTDMEHVYEEGTHLMFPWNEMVVYDARVQEVDDTVDALSKDGLLVGVEYSIQFMPTRNALGRLHRYVGPDYVAKIVVPEANAATREVISRYKPDELYFKDRGTIQAQVLEKVRQKGMEKYITFMDVMIRSIHLPDRIESAIEGKLEQEQRQLAYTYRLAAENEEAQRKRIEAQGIADFEKISGIPILKWRGLEATEKLAQSPNSKVVVIGRNDDELPVILGGEK